MLKESYRRIYSLVSFYHSVLFFFFLDLLGVYMHLDFTGCSLVMSLDPGSLNSL